MQKENRKQIIGCIKMTKKTIAITVDVDAYEEAKDRGYPLSKILNDALHAYIEDHKSVDELQKENEINQETIATKKLENEVLDLNESLKTSKNPRFYVKMYVEMRRKNGDSDIEIDKVLSLAFTTYRTADFPRPQDTTDQQRTPTT